MKRVPFFALLPVVFLTVAGCSNLAIGGGASATTSDGKVSMKLPKGWDKPDQESEKFKAVIAEVEKKNPAAVAQVRSIAAGGFMGAEIIGMDLQKGTYDDLFIDNINIVRQPSPPGQPSKADIENILKQSSMVVSNAQTEVIELKSGLAGRYTGTTSMPGMPATGLDGYIVFNNGTSYIFSFTTTPDKLESKKAMFRKAMESVTFN